MYICIRINCKYRFRIYEIIKLLKQLVQRQLDLYKKYAKFKAGLGRPIKVAPYQAVKGCEIDAMFGQAMMRLNCAVQVERMGAGKYRFGSRNIIAKIINGKLVIRVGGGYMSVDEFI